MDFGTVLTTMRQRVPTFKSGGVLLWLLLLSLVWVSCDWLPMGMTSNKGGFAYGACSYRRCRRVSSTIWTDAGDP